MDESSAGFFALGMAKGSRGVVAVVTTSGTATANLLPAMVEAQLTGVPLIAITADRPPELVDWGANQTIEQSGIYGAHVKWSVDMPVPEAELDLVGYASAVGEEGLCDGDGISVGPVHLNVPFREPLAPVVVEGEVVELSGGDGILDGLVSATAPDGWEAGRELAERLKGVERGIIVCGPQDKPGLAEAVAGVGRSLGYPIPCRPFITGQIWEA